MDIFKILKENNIELKEKRKNIYIIWIKNKYFKGISKCDPNDKYSSIVGGELARIRAYKKYYKYLIKRNKENKKLIEIYNSLNYSENNLINSYIKSNKIIQDFKERKQKGLPSRQKEFEQKLKKLIENKKNIK